jgi:hypothetical protein
MRPTLSVTRHALAGFLLLAPAMASAQWDVEDYKPQFSFSRQPTASLFYGFSSASHDGLHQSLASSGALEIRVGGTRTRWGNEEAEILKNSYEFATLSTMSPRLGSAPGPEEISMDLWKFGFAFERGLGYGSDTREGLAVILTNSGGLNWTDVQIRGGVTDSADQNLLSRYEGSLRFGNSTEAGIKVRLSRMLILEGAFERSLIFPRHLFTKWAGSALIELAAQGLLDGFVGKVLHSTPEAAPVVAFLLKNGLSYGFYELRKTKMNWPFPSEAPYVTDTFKLGVTFVF